MCIIGGRFPGSGGWGDGDAEGHAYGSHCLVDGPGKSAMLLGFRTSSPKPGYMSLAIADAVHGVGGGGGDVHSAYASAGLQQRRQADVHLSAP